MRTYYVLAARTVRSLCMIYWMLEIGADGIIKPWLAELLTVAVLSFVIGTTFEGPNKVPLANDNPL